MSKCVIFKGNTYTEEEYNNIPLAEKMEVLLTSPYLQQYLDLGYRQLSKDGMVYAVTPIAQETYEEALSEFNDVKEHSKNIIDKIREIFSKSEDLKKVDAALVVLDTLAQAWSDKTGRPKEYYYQRYLDVKQSNVSDLVGGKTLFQIIGERGVVNLSDSINRLQNLQLAKSMLNQGAPMEVIKQMTSWEQEDGVWKTEVSDMWGFTVRSMPRAGKKTTVGELIENAKVLESYPQLADIQIEFDNFSNYFAASYLPEENRVMVNKQYVKNLTDLKGSLIHELQHAVQEIEGWQQGTNPDEAGSQENYINSVGEVEARNASKRMTLTDEEKLSSLLVDSADISPEDRIYIEDVSALAARQEQPINKDFKTTENENREGFDEGREPIKPNILFQTDKVSVEYAISIPDNTDGIYRAAVEFNSENQAVLHALNAPNVSSLVHEFAHMFEQDLSDEDIETLEDWSGFEQGTTEFREMVAEGFEKFISEDHPELSVINQVFAKIAKWISNLYRSLTSSPLNLELSDDVRLVYAKVLGVEQAFSSRLNRSQNAILEMSNEERLLMIKKAGNLKQRMPSSLPFDTKVVKKNGSIGIVGREDLSGTTQKEKADGIGDVLSYYLVSDLANIYDKSKKLTIPGKKSIVPSC